MYYTLHLRKIIALMHMLLLCIATIFLKPFFFLQKKKIRFFIDRPYGIDNAYWLYKHCKKLNVEEIQCVYLCKNNEDQGYKNLGDDAGIIHYFSLRHFWYFIHADALIYAYDTAPFYFNSLGKYFKTLLKPLTKLIFLSHGVTRGYLHTISYTNTYYSLFCSVGEREKKLLQDALGQKNVVITGYPRFDILLQKKQYSNKIIFLPAWRENLSFGRRDNFQQSQYFIKIQSFLASPDLHKLLDTYKTTLVWHPHQYIESFVDAFHIDNPNILLNIGKDKKSISSLFQEMGLLITDNSGAQFDAAYMKKPVLYYDFYPYHIDDLRMHSGNIGLFGDHFSEEEELIHRVKHYLEKGMYMEYEYAQRVEDFFSHIDDKNCERCCDELLKMLH